MIVAVGSAVLLATNLLLPLPTDTLGTTAASEQRAPRDRAARREPGDTVMAVPADCDPTFVSYQVFHRAPVVGCAGSFAANPWQSELAYTRSERVHQVALRSQRSTAGSPRPTGPLSPLRSPTTSRSCAGATVCASSSSIVDGSPMSIARR